MAKVTIDGNEVEVQDGINVIEAAKAADVHVHRPGFDHPVVTPDSLQESIARHHFAALPGEQIPRRHFDRRLGHVVAANRLERGEQIPRVIERRAEDARGDEVGDDVPRGRAPLSVVALLVTPAGASDTARRGKSARPRASRQNRTSE